MNLATDCAPSGPAFIDSVPSKVGGCPLNAVPSGVYSSKTKFRTEAMGGKPAVIKKPCGLTSKRVCVPTDYTAVKGETDHLYTGSVHLAGSL